MSRRRRMVTCVLTTVLILPIGATVASSAGASMPTATTQDAPRAAAKAECRKGRVALTFDDGPQPRTTMPLLRVLRDKKVYATFFVQGYRARAYRGLVRRINYVGHTVGNHTWNHPDLTKLSSAAIRSQFVRTNRAIKRAGAPRPTLMRAPYGATNQLVRRVAHGLRLHQVLWSVDTGNWSGISVDAIVRRALSGIRPGDNIVLMHDGVATTGRTVKAVPRIIRGIRGRGYCVAPLNARGKVRGPYHLLQEKHWSVKGKAR